MKHLKRSATPWVLATALFIPLYSLPATAAQTLTLQGKIVSVGESYGNLDTDIELSIITLGQRLSVSCKEHSVEAVFVTGYGDVASGEWLALENEDGMLQFAISFGDASETLNCGVGDAITVTVEAPVSF